MRRLLIFIVYAALALAVSGIAGYLVVSFMVHKSPQVEVPDLKGMTLADALDHIAELKLDLEVRDFTFSTEVEENRVVSQRPVPGKVIKSGRSIGVILSRGPKRHALPDVRGMRVEDASILLTEAGIKFTVDAKVSGADKDTVYGIDATPGVRLPSGHTVSLIVSDGPRTPVYRMPRLDGATLGKAEKLLSALGLRVERIEEVKLGDPTRAGRITSQDPLPGFPVSRGSGVTLSVASGGEKVQPRQTELIQYYVPPSYSSRLVEVVVEGDDGSRVEAQEEVAGGVTFRRLITYNPGERVRLLVDGEPR